MPLKFSPISWERLRVGQEFSPGAFYRRSWRRWWWWWWRSGRVENPPRLAADSRRRKRAGGRGRRETYPRRGNTILKLVRAEQISGPEISLVTRYMYTHKGRKQREREREEDKVIRASTCKMEGWKEGRGEKKRRAKRREEGERWRQSIRRVFSMRLERNYFISGR